MIKERLFDKPDFLTLSRALEAMKTNGSTNGVSSIALAKFACGLDQMNWQEVVNLLLDLFAYADVQIVVYTLDGIGVQEMSAEFDDDFHTD